MEDDSFVKRMLELRALIEKAISDPNGECNSNIGACKWCSAKDRCKICPRKEAEDKCSGITTDTIQ